MRTALSVPLLLWCIACGGAAPGTPAPEPLALPSSVSVRDPRTGRELTPAQLLQRAAQADVVLLGEQHDNPAHHQVRGLLLSAAPTRPAVVFEQFTAADGPIPPPGAAQPLEPWLDAHGFDRTGWRWPLHEPVVRAAIAHGREIRGSNLSRESLRSVVRGGADSAPAPLRDLIGRAPMDSAARGALDRELVAGHCGQLPDAMVPGMRAAQEARDAAMVRAILAAVGAGPVWLIAGNGHVRADIAVPRMLRRLAPERRVLAVGLLERSAGGEAPALEDQRRYDLVIVTPGTPRADPCAGVRR